MRTRLAALVLAFAFTAGLPSSPPSGWARAQEPAARLTLRQGPSTDLADEPAEELPPEADELPPEAEEVTPATAPAQAATAPTSARASPPADLDACRQAYMKGEYASAEAGYRRLASQESMRLEASIGLARCLATTGRYEQAIEALEAAKDQGASWPQWQLALAEAIEALGRYEQALEHAAKACSLKSDLAEAILAQGRLLEKLGRKDQARKVYRTMDKVVAGEAWRNDAASMVALGMILDRCAILEGRKASEQAANILHNYLQEAYQRVDAKYWPANVAAGYFLMSKHKWAAARKEFALALKANPRIPDALAGLATAELHEWRFEQCIARADAALRINPRHDQARLVKALCLMQWRKHDQVPPLLDEILKVNPNHLEALSLYAAFHIRAGLADKAEPYVKRVEKVHPLCPLLENTIGEWLVAVRRFEQAEQRFRKAIELGPELAEPLTNLGLLYMQTGQEERAKEVLEKAHRIDDFRSDVYNYLKLLDELEKFLVKQTEHFIVKVDGRQDAILLEQVAAYMEKIYPEVCGDFDYHPPEKTIIEIFPTHPQFSVRISGKAWIGTIGAATGRVIVLVAPNERRSEFGTFNWGTVLRHEFTHIVTIGASGNQVPHWFTEACAVWQQPDRLNYEATQVLLSAIRQGRLFGVRELDWGFIRPQRGGDRMLAYAQAEWMLEHIIATRGYETVIRMLKAWRDGSSQEQVFAEVLGVSEGEFDKAFAEWGRQQVQQWGYDPSGPPELSAAQAKAQANPTDAAAQATLAAALIARGEHARAQQAARTALDLDESNVQAAEVLARSLLAQGKHQEAAAAARTLQQLDQLSRTAARVLAECYLEQKAWAQAIAALETLKQRARLDPFSYTKLAEIYTQLGKPAMALPNLIELHRRTLKDPQYARRIADLYRAAAQEEQALRYYEQITQINPYDSSAYQAMASIHLNAGRHEDSIAAMRNCCMLEPKSAEAWTGLAMVHYRAAKASGDKAQLSSAREAAVKALEIDPQCQARDLLEYIDEALKD